MSAAIDVRNLIGGYGFLPVYRNVSFSVANGETIGLYGANGSGKTTLLRTIVGLLPAYDGTVTFNGRDITAIPTYRRVRAGLALVPEGRKILGGLTVEDNLRLVRAAWSRSRRGGFEGQLNGVYELFPRLKERARQLGGSLSGGEQQMLAIGRAVVAQPSLLILDEPTQGLAPVVVKELARVLISLKARFSMIIVEQNKEFLDGLVDTKYEMNAGIIQHAHS